VIEKDIILNPSQSQVFTADNREIIYLSGVGGGKTFILAAFIYTHSCNKGSIGLCCAPTYPVMKTSTFKGITEAFEIFGLVEGTHYVVGIRPPESWGVKPYSKLNNSLIITWRNGSYTVLGSLENFNAVRGAEYDYICIDEFRDTKFSEVRKVLIGRLRGVLYKRLKLDYKLLWVSTPPDDVRELNTVLKNPEIKHIQGSSFENKDNLPEGYIESLLSTYDSLTAQREVYGLPVSKTNEKQFAYEYDAGYHYVSFKELGFELNKKEPIKLAFDFNVNPITCILGQSDETKIRIFKAFTDKNSDTQQLCDKIKAWLGNDGYTLFVTGDANGYKRDTRGTLNDYQIIQKAFGISKYQLLAPKANKSIRDSRVLCNSILANFDVAINSDNENCIDLHQDLLFVTVDDEGKIDKKKHGAHTIDDFRYYIHTWHFDFLKRKL
jgi:hypothetical protein